MRLPVAVFGLALLAIAAGIVLYYGTTHEEPAPGGTIVEGLLVDGPLVLLPPFAPNQNSTDVASLLDRGLTRTGGDGRAVPELATRWEVGTDSKTFTFHLRHGLQWSDGVPLTASDAIYTLSVLQDTSLSQTALGLAWSGITASAPDPTTVVYSLPVANSAFLSQTDIGLIPEHFLKPKPVASLPMVLDAPTSGPFRYESSDRNTIVLKRNPRSFEHARLDGIQLRRYDSATVAEQALGSGDIDMLAQLMPGEARSVGGEPNRHVQRAASFAYVELLFNQKVDILADPAVRRGIARAIDTGALISGPIGGFGRSVGSPFPPAISWLGGVQDQPGYDPAAAAAALDGAGWKLPDGQRVRTKSGIQLALKLLHSDVDPYPAEAGMIRASLARSGIRVDLVARTQQQVIDTLAKGGFDMALLPIDNGPDPDVYPLWHSSQFSPAGDNFSGMQKDDMLDQALVDGRNSSDLKARRTAYVTVAKILVDAAEAVFLYSPDQLLGVSNRLKGVRLDPGLESGGRYAYAQDWYVNTRRVR